MVAVMDQEMQQAIRDEVNEILSGRAKFTPEHEDRIDVAEAQIRGMLQDRSFGRILDGPLWLSGTSVVNGSIAAEKLTVTELAAITANMGTVNVTGTLTAAAAYPATTGERITLTSSELAGYNSSDAKTFSLEVDGSGFIGIGSSKLSWDTAGVVTVPSAAIGSLTIADIGSGTFNNNFDAGTGRVRAGTALQRVELTSSGLHAYNTSGTETFELNAANGSMSMVGTFELKNAASGARVEMASVGVRGYNSAGTLTFSILSSDGSGQLGAGTPVTWDASGTVTVNGSLLVGNTVTSDKINVSTLSAISANMGTITAGSITAGSISASTINSSTMSAARISGGSLGGGFNLGGSDVTVNSTGVITNSDGDTWGPNGLTLVSAGSFGDAIKWVVSGTDKGSIYATASGIWFEGASSGGQVFADAGGGLDLYYSNSGEPSISLNSTSITIATGATVSHSLNSSGDLRLHRRLSMGNQTTRYLTDNGTSLDLQLGAGNVGGSAANWSSFGTTNIPDASAGYLRVYINGIASRIPFYADA